MRIFILAAPLLAALLLATAPVRAEEPIELKSGPGQEVTQAACAACHTLDYIRMNSPFLSADGWKAEVTKMRTAFGAAIDDSQADEIQKYLSTNYGAPAS